MIPASTASDATTARSGLFSNLPAATRALEAWAAEAQAAGHALVRLIAVVDAREPAGIRVYMTSRSDTAEEWAALREDLGEAVNGADAVPGDLCVVMCDAERGGALPLSLLAASIRRMESQNGG